MITENISTLKIQKLTKDQFQNGLENNILDDTSIYLTPVEIKDYALKSELNIVKENLNKKIDSDNVYTKTEINGLISGVFHYQGSVDTFEELPNSANVGDVYNVKNANDENHVKAGDNVVWCEIDGIGYWDILSGIIDLSSYATSAEVTNKINEISEVIDKKVNRDSLSTVAFSNDYLDLDNIPNVYTKGEVNNIKTELEYEILKKIDSTDDARLMLLTEAEKLNNIEESANNYTLPAATETALGGVKVGSHLAIGEDEKLSVTLDWNSLDGKPELYSKSETDNLLKEKQDVIEKYAITVNGQSGDVLLTFQDVGALPLDTVIPTVPTNISAFTNDVGYLKEHQDLSNYVTKNVTDDLSNNLNTLSAAAQVKENLTQDLSADQASTDKYPSAKAVYDKIALKQDTLTFDTIPTKDSANPVTSGGVETALGIVREIAEGKCKSYVFNDAATLTDWLTNYADTSTLKTGDIFLIREVNVPDYWWEPVAEAVTLEEYTNKDIIINGKGACRVLETTKIDLTDYALKSDIPITLSELNEDENHRLVTDAEKQAWNAKSNFSGDYKDLNNKPTKLSEFTNDLEGFITQDQVITLIEDYLAGYKLRIVSDENDAGQENYLTIIK